MIKLVLSTALIHLPAALLCGLLGFAAARWGLSQGRGRLLRLVKAVLFLCLAALAAGMAYGVLRFSGALRFPGDSDISYHWFDASWRDDGFRFIYGCGAVLTGLAAAWLLEKGNKGDNPGCGQ